MKKGLFIMIIFLCIILFFLMRNDQCSHTIISGMIGGLIALLFLEINKLYKKRKSIKKGLEDLKRGKSCFINELEIIVSKRKEQENSLNVRNSPLWIYKIKTDNADEQFKLLISHFDTLRKNPNWEKFTIGKTVFFNLYSDESFEEEIIKTTQKEYGNINGE